MMVTIGGFLLSLLVIFTYKGVNRIFERVAMIIAARCMIRDLNRKSLCNPKLITTRDQALEYLRQPDLELVADFTRKASLYHILILIGFIDGFIAFNCYLLQPSGPELWYMAGALIFLFALSGFKSYRSALKAADWIENPYRYEVKPEDELITFAQTTHRECNELFEQIEQLGGRSWKKLRTVCIAAAVILAAAQLSYELIPFGAGDGTLKLGNWQYRVLDDGTAEVLRYSGIWKEVTVPSSFYGVPVSSMGPNVFKWERKHELPFSRKPLTALHLPQGLVRIGDNALEDCCDLPELMIPDTVTWIGNEAFDSCSMLKEILLPDGLIHIGDYAFCSCMSITAIHIPDSVTEIGANPFVNCVRLRTIEFTENQPLLRLCGDGLCRAENMELVWYPEGKEFSEVTVPSGIRRIGDGAFRYGSLEKVILPEGLEEIGNMAFSSCFSLRDIVFPSSLLNIGDDAFNHNINLVKVVFPDSVRSIGDRAFHSCSGLTSIHLSDRLTQLGESAFSSCSKLEEITVPAGVAEIRENTFRSCQSLTGAVLPEGLTSIGDFAFSDCANLAGIVLPEGLTSIGKAAFVGCGKLAAVAMPASVQDFGGRNPFLNNTVWIVTRGSRAEEFCQAYRINFLYAGDEAAELIRD